MSSCQDALFERCSVCGERPFEWPCDKCRTKALEAKARAEAQMEKPKQRKSIRKPVTIDNPFHTALLSATWLCTIDEVKEAEKVHRWLGQFLAWRKQERKKAHDKRRTTRSR